MSCNILSMEATNQKFENIKDAFAYTFAGKATITLESHKTGTHFTYRIRQAKDNNGLFFVSVLGQGGERKYNYIGIVTEKGFRRTAKSTVAECDPCFKAFSWYYGLKELPWQLNIHHEGQCGCCGRQLTNPASITRGIGPECATRYKISPVVPIEELDTVPSYDS